MSLNDKALRFIYPILYILNKVSYPVDLYHLVKILYFADKECLSKYGISITGDTYEKMNYGPVPTNSYSLLDAVKGNSPLANPEDFSAYLKHVGNHYFIATSKVNLEEFSQVEMECLDHSIDENLHKSFDELKEKSHDEAYHSAKLPYDNISLYDIAKAGGATSEQIAYMKERDTISASPLC